MKKILLVCLYTTLVIGIISAQEKKVLLEWDFDPEVSTTGGWNMDSSGFGLEGTAKLDLETVIHEEADEEFTGDGEFYGKIVVEDLEIKIDTGEQASDYDSTATGATTPLVIKWGTIKGTVYLGPVYLELKNTDHDQVDFIETLDDGDLDFTNIEYSIIPAYYTGAYVGRSPDASDNNSTGALNSSYTVGQAINNDFSETLQDGTDNLSAISVGYELPDIIKLELGLGTQYTYLQSPGQYYNPFDISLAVEVLAVDNMIAKVKGNASSGRNNSDLSDAGGFMTEGNPITVGAMVGYKLDLGSTNLTLTPKIAGEMQFERKRKLDTSYHQPTNSSYTVANGYLGTNAYSFNNSAYDYSENSTIFTYPYEAALGVTLDWKTMGIDDYEDDHLDFANDVDFDATDGISLAAVYGAVPLAGIRELTSPYVGVKLSIWESEDTGKPGLIDGLKAGFIANANYAFGQQSDITDLANGKSSSSEIDSIDNGYYTSYKYNYGARIDVGAGLEASYEIQYIRPFVGTIFKWFDITDAENTVTRKYKTSTAASAVEVTDDVSIGAIYYNQMDLRARLGMDVIKLISNTTITGQWVSGDLINKVGNVNVEYNTYDYFKNNNGTSSVDPQNTNIQARLGYISLGVKIEF